MQKYIDLVRPKNWLKNLIIFIPLFFSGDLLERGLLGRVMLGFVLFTLLTVSLYLINDLFDREKDQDFNKKSERPLASGSVSQSIVIGLTAIMGFAAIIGGFALEPELGLLMLGYLVLALWYSAWLQNIAMLGSVIVATLYILRVVAGSIIIGLEVSPWLVLVVASASLPGIFLKLLTDLQDRKEKRPEAKKEAAFYRVATTSLGFIAILTMTAFSLLAPEANLAKENGLFFANIILLFLGLRFGYQVFINSNMATRDPALPIGALVYIITLFSLFYL